MAAGWIRREEKSCGTRDPWGGGNSVKMEGDGSLVTRAKEHVGLPETGRGSKAPPPEAVETARPHHLDLRPPISRTVGPGDSDGRESACRAGVLGSIPGLGGSPGEGNGYPRQYSCLKKSTGRGAWRATDHGIAKSRTRLSDFHSLIHSRAVREHVLSLQANQPGTLLCSSRELTHWPHY